MSLARRNAGSGHSYKVDGEPMPGVTTILKQLPSPGLTKWAAETTANYAVDNWAELDELRPSERLARLNRARHDALNRAGVRGTKVHKLAEPLVIGGKPETIPEDLAPHVESYREWLELFRPDPVAVELVLANREVGYCGTADLVAYMMGQIWLLDLKTKQSGIWRETALQCCAYARAETYAIPGDETEHPLAELGIERVGAVWIRGDGCDLYPLDGGEDNWDYFQHLAWLHHHDTDRRAWVGEVMAPPPLAVA